MPDPREWVSRIREVEPPELWEEASARARGSGLADVGAPLSGGRKMQPTTARRAALVAGAVVGIPLLVLIMLAIATRTPGGNRNTPTPAVSSLSDVHALLERHLSDLWIAEARLDELQGALGAAQDELAALQDEIGPDPSDAQLQEIETLQERIQTWTRTALEDLAVVQRLRARVDQIRLQRERLLPPPDDAAYPLVATVTCDGDRTGGTHVSAPVVRLQPGGVDLHVVNRIPNERVFLTTGPGDEVFAVPAGATEDSHAAHLRADQRRDRVHVPSTGRLRLAATLPSSVDRSRAPEVTTSTPSPEPTALWIRWS